MSYSSGSGGATSQEYENNVRFDSGTTELLNQLKTGLSQRLNYDKNSYKSGQNVLQSLMQGTYNYKENPYVSDAVKALQASNYDTYQKQVAQDLSAMQGLGRGTTINRLANNYNNYVLDTNKAIADLKLNQYNQDIGTVLEGVKQSSESDVFNQAANTLVQLANVVKETYGTQPVQTSERTGYGVKN